MMTVLTKFKNIWQQARSLAGSFVKNLSREIFVTGVDDLKLNSECHKQFKCISWKMFCPVQVNTSLIKNNFIAGYHTVAHICKHNKQFLKHITIFLEHKSIL